MADYDVIIVGAGHNGDRAHGQAHHHDHEEEHHLGGEPEGGQRHLRVLQTAAHRGIDRQRQHIQDIESNDG